MEWATAPGDPLTVFISARVQEMTAERLAAGEAVAAMRLRPVLFEHTRHLVDERPVFLEAARTCDVFVGLYGNEYGESRDGRPSAIEQEFLETLASPLMPRLLFVRRSRRRQHALLRYLDRASALSASYTFADHQDLGGRIRHALAGLLATAYRERLMLVTVAIQPPLAMAGEAPVRDSAGT